jgi:hypothetical protein
MNSRRWAAFLAAAVLAAVSPARAQETRADVLRRAREEKQRAASPYRPNAAERILKASESGGVPLITRDGIYAKLGSLTTGSGFAYGAGYRTRRLFRRDGLLDVWGGASLKGYWAAQAAIGVRDLADGRLEAEAYARRHEYTQEDYFGLGPSSPRSAQADYAIRMNTFGARAAARLGPIVRVGGGLEYVQPRVGNGTDDSLFSIGDRFDEQSAPGLSAQPDYLRPLAFVDVDWRRPLNARNGGWYRAEFSRYDDRDLAAYSFNRFDVDLRQFVGFFSERRVLAGRIAASTSDTSAGQQVPFYLMPSLGGNDSLRGFRDYRFRGPHALLLQGEYRFEIWSGLDGALFYDAGKVALRRADLDFKDLETDYGIGFRFNTDNGIVVRVDAAFGSRDGKHLWIVFGGRL